MKKKSDRSKLDSAGRGANKLRPRAAFSFLQEMVMAHHKGTKQRQQIRDRCDQTWRIEMQPSEKRYFIEKAEDHCRLYWEQERGGPLLEEVDTARLDDYFESSPCMKSLLLGLSRHKFSDEDIAIDGKDELRPPRSVYLIMLSIAERYSTSTTMPYLGSLKQLLAIKFLFEHLATKAKKRLLDLHATEAFRWDFARAGKHKKEQPDLDVGIISPFHHRPGDEPLLKLVDESDLEPPTESELRELLLPFEALVRTRNSKFSLPVPVEENDEVDEAIARDSVSSSVGVKKEEPENISTLLSSGKIALAVKEEEEVVKVWKPKTPPKSPAAVERVTELTSTVGSTQAADKQSPKKKLTRTKGLANLRSNETRPQEAKPAAPDQTKPCLSMPSTLANSKPDPKPLQAPRLQYQSKSNLPAPTHPAPLSAKPKQSSRRTISDYTPDIIALKSTLADVQREKAAKRKAQVAPKKARPQNRKIGRFFEMDDDEDDDPVEYQPTKLCKAEQEQQDPEEFLIKPQPVQMKWVKKEKDDRDRSKSSAKDADTPKEALSSPPLQSRQPEGLNSPGDPALEEPAEEPTSSIPSPPSQQSQPTAIQNPPQQKAWSEMTKSQKKKYKKKLALQKKIEAAAEAEKTSEDAMLEKSALDSYPKEPAASGEISALVNSIESPSASSPATESPIEGSGLSPSTSPVPSSSPSHSRAPSSVSSPAPPTQKKKDLKRPTSSVSAIALGILPMTLAASSSSNAEPSSSPEALASDPASVHNSLQMDDYYGLPIFSKANKEPKMQAPYSFSLTRMNHKVQEEEADKESWGGGVERVRESDPDPIFELDDQLEDDENLPPFGFCFDDSPQDQKKKPDFGFDFRAGDPGEDSNYTEPIKVQLQPSLIQQQYQEQQRHLQNYQHQLQPHRSLSNLSFGKSSEGSENPADKAFFPSLEQPSEMQTEAYSSLKTDVTSQFWLSGMPPLKPPPASGKECFINSTRESMESLQMYPLYLDEVWAKMPEWIRLEYENKALEQKRQFIENMKKQLAAARAGTVQLTTVDFLRSVEALKSFVSEGAKAELEEMDFIDEMAKEGWASIEEEEAQHATEKRRTFLKKVTRKAGRRTGHKVLKKARE